MSRLCAISLLALVAAIGIAGHAAGGAPQGRGRPQRPVSRRARHRSRVTACGSCPSEARKPGRAVRAAGGRHALPVGRLVEARVRLLRARDVGVREARRRSAAPGSRARPTWAGACHGGSCCRATSSSSAATATSACTSAAVAWCTLRRAVSGCGWSVSPATTAAAWSRHGASAPRRLRRSEARSRRVGDLR